MSSILKVNTIQDGGGNAIITSDGSGNFTMTNGKLTGQNYPAFHAFQNTHPGGSLTANTATKVIFDSEYFDTDSAYNTSTGLFTVPSGKAGKYFAVSTISMQANLTNIQPLLYKNSGSSATDVLRGTGVYNSAGSSSTVTGTFDLAVGDTLSVYVKQVHNQPFEGVTDGRTATYFLAYRIGA
tara:strand:- start:33 stop:578 length:546 start_codon:yes stop_codon:yes gene_type:complete